MVLRLEKKLQESYVKEGREAGRKESGKNPATLLNLGRWKIQSLIPKLLLCGSTLTLPNAINKLQMSFLPPSIVSNVGVISPILWSRKLSNPLTQY